MFNNVFVLCTGRCGSVSLARSFGYVKNYTTGHETLAHLVGSSRLGYPKDHIEVDNRLSWMLGRLHSKYGDDAFYVHLKRDRLAVAESFLKRFDRGIMAAYHSSVIMSGLKKNPAIPKIDFCLDYCDTVNQNIALFLEDKSHQLTVNLENMDEDLPRLWGAINAEGDLESALKEFSKRHNASDL